MAIKSNTKIEAQLKTKTNPVLVETVVLAKKNEAWKEAAGLLTTPGSNKVEANLSDLEKTEGDIICVAGKVLSSGEISKKVKIVAFKFSAKAEKKLKDAGCEVVSIKDEIKNNKDAKGVVFYRK